MQVFEAYPGMYRFQLLPGFARFILQNHLNDFVKEQVHLSFGVRIPLLLNLMERFSREQLEEFSKKGSFEMLTYLSENNAYDQVSSAMDKWLKDELEIIGKFQIVARDITLVSYVRQQALNKFIPLYASDLQQAVDLCAEIDRLTLGSNTTATDIYFNLMKEKLEAESLFTTKLIAASPAITFLFDIVHNKEVFVSGKVTEVMGYTPEELTSMGNNILLLLTHPADLKQIAVSLEELVAENSDTVRIIEYRFLHKEGGYRWLRTYYVIFKRDELGLPVELLGKTFEVTREKETALALQRREEQLLEAQALAYIGSFDWNISEHTSVNTPEVYRIFEINDDENFESFMTHVHPEDAEKVREAMSASFTSGNYDCEYRYVKNGNEKIIWSLGKVEFEKGRPKRMVGTVQDVTNIKMMERQLVERTKQLQQSNKSLEQFASVASHDLKEPLRKISVFADLILEAEKTHISEASVDKLHRMQRSAKAMMGMIQDILAFSMLESKQEKQNVDLGVLTHEVLNLLDERIKERKANVIVGALPQACVIPSQFRQMLQNLISNGMKFSRKGRAPEIRISYQWLNPPVEGLTTSNRVLQLEVCDNGIGIEGEYLESIFELFTRLHSKAEYEGSGLGLAITKRIVDNHGGVIRASSTPGVGTCFHILLPQ